MSLYAFNKSIKTALLIPILFDDICHDWIINDSTLKQGSMLANIRIFRF